MKRFISVVLLVVMIMTVCTSAFADIAFKTADSLAKGKATNSYTTTKTSGNGTAARVSTAEMTSKATFHFRVHKYTGWKASEGVLISGKGSKTMATLYENGNSGNPRLWKGVSYYLAATHSSKSKVNTASCRGTFHP